MSATNQVTPWFFQNRPVRLPAQVVDALIKNEISPLQFCILAMLHRRAGWETGVILSFSAEQVIYDLGDTGLIPAGAIQVRRRFVRRDMQSLRDHGWYHWDYQEGSKRPYTIWLHNYSAQRGCVSPSWSQEQPCHEKNDACDHEEHILNRCEITPCNRRHRKLDHEKDDPCDHVVTPSNRASGSNAAEASTTRPCSPSEVGTLPSESSLINRQDSPVVRVPSSVASQDKTTNQDAAFGDGGLKGSGQEKIRRETRRDARRDAGKRLANALSQIAEELLRSTHGTPDWLSTRCQSLAAVYGIDAVSQDFTRWCAEPCAPASKFPISVYDKVVDSRLGGAPADTPLNLADPQVAELVAFSFKQTGQITPAIDCARLLQTYPLADINDALTFYCADKDNPSQKYIAAFYADCAGVKAILQTLRAAEREHEEERAKQAAREAQAKADAQAKAIKRRQDETERLAITERENQVRLAQQAADAAQRAERLEAERIAYQHDFQLRNDFRTIWDDPSIDMDDWCAAHLLANGTSFFDDPMYSKAMEYRRCVHEKKEEVIRQQQAAIPFLQMALQDGETHSDADLYAAALAVGIAYQFVDEAAKTLGCVERELGPTLFGAARGRQLPTGVKS